MDKAIDIPSMTHLQIVFQVLKNHSDGDKSLDWVFYQKQE